MKPNHFGVTSLNENLLSNLIPTRTFAGGTVVENPAETLFLWRSTAAQRARDGTLAFFLDDARLEPLWAHPERYAIEFKRFGIASVIEPDFSLWTDTSLDEQLHNVRRKKIVSRIFQEHGLPVVPNLNWSDESSFRFSFAGIPQHAPVAMMECRTAGGNDDDRRTFLAGLTEGVKQVQPQHVIVYGGKEHAYWLAECLPKGPTYTLLEAWTSARGKVRKAQERAVREENQPNLFTGGNEKWADVDQAAA